MLHILEAIMHYYNSQPKNIERERKREREMNDGIRQSGKDLQRSQL